MTEFDCPKCEQEAAFKISFVGSDNGLPGAYFQSFLEPDLVERECDCEFTKEELNEFLFKCADRHEESLYDYD